MQLEYNVDLKSLNTFGLHAHAAAFYRLTQAEALPEICRLPEFARESVLWLGGGSNVLFMQDYPGLVVQMANRGIRELRRENGKVWLEAEAGEIWHDFVLGTLAAGLSGLENLSLIPGTVGAAPVQNIGAYGVEVKDVIDYVRCFDLDEGVFVDLSNADCRFAYRDSLFKQAGKGRYVIVAVVFVLNEHFEPQMRYGDVAAVAQSLSTGGTLTAKDVSDAVCQIRASKLPDPNILGNVGSFYKNPLVPAATATALLAHHPSMPHYPQPDGMVKLAAGWLVDQCGLKGYTVGGAAVHDKQALVLVNRNAANAADLQALSEHICLSVHNKFSVWLESEPNWLPEGTGGEFFALSK